LPGGLHACPQKGRRSNGALLTTKFRQRINNVHAIAAVPEAKYSPFMDSYACSKRANRYFTWLLNQRLSGVKAVSCHPGWTGTNLQHRATGMVRVPLLKTGCVWS